MWEAREGLPVWARRGAWPLPPKQRGALLGGLVRCPRLPLSLPPRQPLGVGRGWGSRVREEQALSPWAPWCPFCRGRSLSTWGHTDSGPHRPALGGLCLAHQGLLGVAGCGVACSAPRDWEMPFPVEGQQGGCGQMQRPRAQSWHFGFLSYCPENQPACGRVADVPWGAWRGPWGQ